MPPSSISKDSGPGLYFLVRVSPTIMREPRAGFEKRLSKVLPRPGTGNLGLWGCQCY